MIRSISPHPVPPPQCGLPDSHIVIGSEDSDAAFYGLDFEPSVEHDDGAWFSVIAGPSAEAGTHPGGIGERCLGVGIFLTCGLAFELGAERVQERPILGLE